MDTRLFPTLQELALNQVIERYGIEELHRVILEDEMVNAGGKVTIAGISLLKPLLIKKLLSLVNAVILSVLTGDLNQTEKLINLWPPLVSLKGEAVDYSRRTIKNLTPFQSALCALDNKMCKMLEQHMNQNEVVDQYLEIFPNGHENYFNAQTPFNFSQLVNIIAQSNDIDVQMALNLQQNNSLLCQMMNQFRIDFTLCSQQERVFNLTHLLNALETYDRQFYALDWNKKDLFWRQVIGFIQRFLPANIAQDFAQGIYHRVEENEKSTRSFNFRFGKGAIFPLVFDSFSGLGFDYAIVTGSGSCEKRAVSINSREPGIWTGRVFYETYVRKKLHACKNYAAMSPTEDKCNHSAFKMN